MQVNRSEVVAVAIADGSANRHAMKSLPVSAVVPTRSRPIPLARTLGSLAAQGVLPAELIVIDGSADVASRQVVERHAGQWSPDCAVVWQAASQLGAAVQRNQGVATATQPFICFCDDDILFEPECMNRLWRAIQSDPKLGGVSAMIVNQKYHPPGVVSRIMFTLMHGRREKSFAGRVIGPAVNLLPEDLDDSTEIVPVEWLNLGCTIYRREALPSPPFDSVFTGYSMMEDLTLSLRVGRKWRLANARTARIFHDSQPGTYKADVTAMAAMELVNRHYVMTEILKRRRSLDYFRLFTWEAFQLFVCAVRAQSRPILGRTVKGKWRAATAILPGKR
jgi:glycosyltransferase involved in cell wall biosynthesis